ncbi:MAG: chemotaxis protein CheC [Phenylobacterium sp.]|jgi:chemotaxis protein CheC
MSAIKTFTPYQIDALKELTNIGMGKAGSMLSEIFEHRVTLKVPDISVVDVDKLSHLSAKFAEHSGAVNIIHQSFIGDIEGRSTFIIGEHNFDSLVEILGYDKSDALDEKRQCEMLLDISNAVNSACLSGLAKQLSLDIELARPLMASFNKPTSELEDFIFIQKNQDVYDTLLFEIKFFIQDLDLYCDNVISLKTGCLKNLQDALGKVI